MRGGKLHAERRADARGIDDDVRGRDVLREGEEGECGGGVGLHGGLDGMAAGAAAVAAVVEEQDVEVLIVESERAGKRVAHGAVAAVEHQCGGAGRVGWIGGNPPAVELRLAGGSVGEVDFGEVEAEGRGRGSDAARRMKDELPLPLRVEEAEGNVGEDDSEREDEAEGLEQPARIDERGRSRGLRAQMLCDGRFVVGVRGALGSLGAFCHDAHDASESWVQSSASHAWRCDQECGVSAWVRLCAVSEAPKPGEVREMEVKGVEVCLANVGGRLAALNNVCPHRQGPLGQGWMEGETVVCPWHCWAFDTRTGEAQEPEQGRVDVLPLRVEGEDVLIALD